MGLVGWVPGEGEQEVAGILYVDQWSLAVVVQADSLECDDEHEQPVNYNKVTLLSLA